MTLPTPRELQSAWEDVKQEHKKYRVNHGVKLPNADRYTDLAKSLWLAVLYHWRDREVHKNEISEIARRDMANAAADQQVRHLKRDGWWIGEKQGVHQLDVYQVSPEFQNQEAHKRARLNATTFDELKASYGGCCATCGAEEGKPDKRYGVQAVTLQQGHQDPLKSGDDWANIIPQCQFCNRAYRDDFAFDNKGRVHAVASIGPVSRAHVSVQKKILDWLIAHLGSKR